MKQVLANTFLVVIFSFASVVILFSSLDYSTKLPIVQFSNSTQKCVQVIPEKLGSCENLPDKYISEWVK